MAVKERVDLQEALASAQSALAQASEDLQRIERGTELTREQADLTVGELAAEFHLPEEAVLEFVRTLGRLLDGESTVTVEAARRAALLTAAGHAWESELGPLLSTPDTRRLLGVSRQRVDELLRTGRLISLPDTAGHRRYPAFQFRDGRPLAPLIAAYWTLADAAISPWSAAAWCVAPDPDALQGLSPLKWALEEREESILARVARQDAARLEH
jgi:hypothetical protein